MARIIDSMGREFPAEIADQDVIVIDPYSNTRRKLMAGKPIPSGLEDAYRVAVGGGEDGGDEVRASAAALKKAEELGVDIDSVSGSGKDGKVTVGDVTAAAEE